MATSAMTTEAETARVRQGRTPQQARDLFGLAYLGLSAVAMTAWIGILLWIAFVAVRWLTS